MWLDDPVMAQLLRRAGRGDRSAFARLLRRRRDRLRQMIAVRRDGKIGSRTDASDVLREKLAEAVAQVLVDGAVVIQRQQPRKDRHGPKRRASNSRRRPMVTGFHRGGSSMGEGRPRRIYDRRPARTATDNAQLATGN